MSWNIPTLPRVQQAMQALRRLHGGLGGEFFWVCVCQLGSAAGCIAGVRLLTEVMRPADYGNLMLAMSVVALVQHVIASPLTVAVQRFFSPAMEDESFAEYRRAISRLVKVAVAGAVIVAVLMSGVAMMLGRADLMGLIACCTLLSLLLATASVVDGMLNAARRRGQVAWNQAATQWLRWILAAVAVVWLGSSATAAMLGACAAFMLLGITRWITWSRFSANRIAAARADAITAGQWNRRLLEYSAPFAFWGTFTWAMAASDRWALAALVGPEQVGAYGVLYQLGFFPLVFMADALQQLVSPILFQRAGIGTDMVRHQAALQLNNRLLMLFSGVITLVVLVCCSLHGWLLSWLAGAAFREHSLLLPWVALAGGLFALGQMAALNIVSGPSARCLLPVKIGSALFGIGANFLGAMCWNLSGVVGATVLSSAIYFVWTIGASRMDLRRKMAVLRPA